MVNKQMLHFVKLDLESHLTVAAPSTSGTNIDITSEDEVVHLLKCSDYYSVFGFSCYENMDVYLLKMEYRKKVMSLTLECHGMKLPNTTCHRVVQR